MKKCHLKISDEDRELIHKRFWEQEKHDRKTWIQSYVHFIEPTQRYSTECGERKRKYIRVFLLPSVKKSDSNRISVCQKMFLGTLGYKTDEVLKTVQDTSDITHILQKDVCEKHTPLHKTSDKDEVFIKEHILNYNPHISHYRLEHIPNHLYLPTELSCMDMHKDYLLDCEEAIRKPYLYAKYWRVVKTMNISFAKLGIKECET